MIITDDMVAAAIKQLGFSPADAARIRAALTAAIAARGPQVARLTRPIVGIERRTAQEVFDIMSGRVRSALVETAQPVAVPDDLLSYYERQIAWSRQTFGPALRTKGILDHIRKELREIEATPFDLTEWVDVVILAMDGFWRHGGKPSDLFEALLAKQKKNMARTWPDWRCMSEDQAIEHDRSHDAAPQPPAVDDGCKRRFALEWVSGARPPVHPTPMRGRQSFLSLSEAVAFMRRQAPDAQFVSLTEHVTQSTVIDRSDEARSTLPPAPANGGEHG